MNARTPISHCTGLPVGDHGTAAEAIDWALDHDRDGITFLEAWRMGQTNRFDDPDYYAWLIERRAAAPATTEPSRLRMWAHQITFTLILVGLIEVGLWFFR